jgi:hypothetical protein
MTDTQDKRKGVRRLCVCRSGRGSVSFPIGGYLADLVMDGVDSVGRRWSGV